MTSLTAAFLKGTLEACPYKGPSALVAASFQLAIVAVRGNNCWNSCKGQQLLTPSRGWPSLTMGDEPNTDLW